MWRRLAYRRVHREPRRSSSRHGRTQEGCANSLLRTTAGTGRATPVGSTATSGRTEREGTVRIGYCYIHIQFQSNWLTVCRSGSALVSINEVTLRQGADSTGMGDRVRGSTPGAGTETSFGHPGQLSLAILPWVGVMSTSQWAVMLCGWGVQAGMVRVWMTEGLRESKILCIKDDAKCDSNSLRNGRNL